MMKKILLFLILLITPILIGVGTYQLIEYFRYQLQMDKVYKYVISEKIKEDNKKFVKQQKEDDWEWISDRMDTIIPNKRDIHYYKNYILVFDIDTCFVETPMDYPAGSPHYQSYVSIYKKSNKDSIFIYKFKCKYTNEKCYEDEPKSLIKESYQLKKENEKTI